MPAGVRCGLGSRSSPRQRGVGQLRRRRFRRDGHLQPHSDVEAVGHLADAAILTGDQSRTSRSARSADRSDTCPSVGCGPTCRPIGPSTLPASSTRATVVGDLLQPHCTSEQLLAPSRPSSAAVTLSSGFQTSPTATGRSGSRSSSSSVLPRMSITSSSSPRERFAEREERRRRGRRRPRPPGVARRRARGCARRP